MAYDLITMRRIGVDIYPLQTGVPLPQVSSFGKFLGGSATNVAEMARRPSAPTVQGLVAGRSLLYPADGDVAAAVDTAVGLL